MIIFSFFFRSKNASLSLQFYVEYFSTFFNLLMNAFYNLLIDTSVEIYTHLYFHLCMHKIPRSFDQCDCIVFRLLLSTHGPNLAHCAIFLNKRVNL